MKERFERLAGVAARRPAVTIGVVLALAIGGGVAALGLKPSTGIDTFVSRSSSSYQATLDDQRHFGSDAVVVLIREPLTDLVLSRDLGTLSFLEACLAGQQVVQNLQVGAYTPAPASQAKPYGGSGSPCGKLMRAKPVQVVYGPGTFLNQAVTAVNREVVALEAGASQSIQRAEQAAYSLALGEHRTKKQAQAAARAAGQLEEQQTLQQAEQLALHSGLTQLPNISDQNFISQVVFDATRGPHQPKARFAYLFPTADSALIQVRLKPTLSDTQRAQAISWIRQAVRMPIFHLGYGGRYTVTGAPVVLNDLSSQITGSIAGLLIAALLVMAATLLIVFRSRLRLLPLGIALAAAGITFGAMSVVGASLTMAAIAVLPILIGLAVDYAIQFQSRVQEAERSSVQGAVARAAGAGAPAIATAALATATGFLILLLSPVPMVRGFGVLLVVGIAFALACALTVVPAALTARVPNGGALGASARGAVEILSSVGRAAVRALRSATRPLTRPASALATPLENVYVRVRGWGFGRKVSNMEPDMPQPRWLRRPSRVLALAAVLAVAGWALDTQTSVQSDVTKLVPSSMPALRDLRTLERVTGVSGEIDVTVRAPDVTKVGVVRWMTNYEQRLFTHFGFLETKGCQRATVCPALSLTDLFQGATGSGATAQLSQTSINELLAAIPSYFKQAVITPNKREAALAFGIRLMPLSKQQRVIDYMRAQLHPPPGVTANLTGIPVLAAEANSALSSSGRRLLTLLAGLVAVGLVLLAVFRKPKRALVPLIPIALATGWSALIVFATRIPLNPMSATLGTLVIAISTEFSVLLSERFRQERALGHDPKEALRRTYRSTGLAVLASGITAIAGFGVLAVSNITMLRDFGFVTLIDLTVSLAGVLVVLPSVLEVAERGELDERIRELARRVGARRQRLRRARVA
jgi:hydrophobe/amphiphile efflux-3 (HAE3) family protein